MSVTPWIDGVSGWQVDPTLDQWRQLGRLLDAVHRTPPPDAIDVPREQFRSNAVAAVGATVSTAPEWLAHRSAFADLARMAESIEDRLPDGPTVICHTDAHVGNLMVGPNGDIHLIDWDDAVLAPAEKDLVLVIGGVLADRPITGVQQREFFDGYGPHRIDRRLLAYFRAIRAFEDGLDFAQQATDPVRSADEQRFAGAQLHAIVGPGGQLERAQAEFRAAGVV